MNLDTYMVGSHMWLFREGDAFTVPANGVCGQESKPGISPTLDAGWIDVGAIETADPTVSQSEHKLWRPSPGRLVLKDVLENQQELAYKVTTNDVGPLAIEMAYRAVQKLQGAQKQFNPISAISKRCWAHFQKYDQNDNLFLTLDLWCRVRVMIKFDTNPTKPEWDLFMLYSSQNTGSIT